MSKKYLFEVCDVPNAVLSAQKCREDIQLFLHL